MRTQGPNISAFPLLDFAARVVSGGVGVRSPGGDFIALPLIGVGIDASIPCFLSCRLAIVGISV